LIFPNIARTQSIKLTLFVTDSLTEESVTNYSVYIDDSIVLPSFDETHIAHFVLNNAIDHTFRIRVHKFHYYDRIFDLKMPKTLSDTTVQVKMNYIMHPFEPYQILYPEEFDQYFHFKDILDEEFIRNLSAKEKSKAMKYNSRITVTVADNFLSTVTHPQKEFCFRFFDKFGAEVTPSEMLVLDNTGAVFHLDSSKCFHHKADTSYSFILKVIDRNYYSLEKQYYARMESGYDTVRLENMEYSVKMAFVSRQPKLNNRQKKQMASFFSNSKRGFHRIDILVGKPTRTKTEAQQCVNDIIMLYEEDLTRRNIQQTPDVMVHFYDLPEGEDTFTIEIEGYDYK
nr:hypothetical protein [Bacteroidales bacterium]